MPTFVTRCKDCGAEFEPTQDAIRAGSWRLCPACPPESSETSHCKHCGRVLRAGMRTICALCLGVSL